LIKAERQKQKRNSFIALISILFIAIISALLLQIRLKNKKIQESIAKLKIAGEIQIAELEEQKQLTKQEEKKKFGIELHDLAGSVAILKMKVETVMLNTKDEDIKESLSNLSKDVSGVYAKARNQSHNWFNQQGLDIEPSFQKRVKYLMETGLPEGKYKTQITVDDDSIRDISLKTKIEILYIVQEAVTNILKHAKANEVTIFIYNDLPGLIIQITDDGVGFDINKKKSGIGLTSIKSRVEALKGSLSIQSFIHKGTTIDITIPISENQFA
ncbi:MAG: hypothetical protein KA160_00635, partial [Lacibacter sp.]|nr:hypothetical protein [Lacibacter sp.]